MTDHWAPETNCRICDLMIPPYQEAVPIEISYRFCWGHGRQIEDFATFTGELAAILADGTRRENEELDAAYEITDWMIRSRLVAPVDREMWESAQRGGD